MNNLRGKGKLTFLLCCLSLLLAGCGGSVGSDDNIAAGMKAIERNDLYGALECFQEAQKKGEDPVLTVRGMGIANLGLNNYEGAEELFEMALELTDDRMPQTRLDIRQYLAAAFFKDKKYDECIAVCDTILDDKQVPEVCYLKGAAFLELSDQEQAGEWFKRALENSDRDYEMCLKIYRLYDERGYSALGDEYLQEALGYTPQTVEDHYHIGRIYFSLGQYNDAISALQKPVAQEYPPAMELMGEIYLATGDSAHARSMYESVMASKGESPVMYNGLALCAMEAGDYDSASVYIQKGLALDEEEGKQQLRFNEIVVCEKKLDFSTALEKAEEYVKLYPQDAEGAREYQFLSTR